MAHIAGDGPNVVATFVLDGPINADALQGYVEKSLVPDLRPGDIVVMDKIEG